MKELKGIIAPVPTPFDDKEEPALDRLKDNLKKWSDTRLSGVVALGSTGEFVYLRTEEKKAVIETARNTVPEQKLLLAGTGCESTREAVALTRWAGGIGVDYAMVIHPFYYKRALKKEILRAYYLEVAEASPVPLVVYNMPLFTRLNLGAELVIELASHPNIAGIKDSAGDVLQVQSICQATPASFSVLTGAASLLLACITVGASGAILAAANVAWDLCVDLYEAFEKGELPRARELQRRLVPINRAVTVDYGIGGLKALLDQLGFYGGPPRRPLQPPPAAIRDELVRIHRENAMQEVKGS